MSVPVASPDTGKTASGFPLCVGSVPQRLAAEELFAPDLVLSFSGVTLVGVAPPVERLTVNLVALAIGVSQLTEAARIAAPTEALGVAELNDPKALGDTWPAME